MDACTGRATNPDLLWSVETLRARLGTPGLSIVDTRPAELFCSGAHPRRPPFRSLLRQLRRYRSRTARLVHAHVCERARLARRLLGYPNVRNYVGSWQEWGNREGLPIARPD